MAHHFSQNHWRLGSQHYAATTSVSGSDIAASHLFYICIGMRFCFHIVFLGSRTSSFAAWIRVGSHIPGGYDLCAPLACARVFSLCRRMHGAPARLFAHELRIGPFVPHRLVLLPSRLSIRIVLSHPSAVSIRETSGCLMPLLCTFEFISLRLVCGFWRWLITTPSVTSQLDRFRLHFSLGGHLLSINGSLPRFTMRARLFVTWFLSDSVSSCICMTNSMLGSVVITPAIWGRMDAAINSWIGCSGLSPAFVFPPPFFSVFACFLFPSVPVLLPLPAARSPCHADASTPFLLAFWTFHAWMRCLGLPSGRALAYFHKGPAVRCEKSHVSGWVPEAYTDDFDRITDKAGLA